ncbi:IMP cyclohydrolase [Oceanidesulfovibrio indonesiensis]|uniref:IMP cyclohydrolase n=1 Tax=Oceanidesulfovibrio indonesiensis TaxID=54767 RepID=A0A7M3MAY0_9BACT|nr:IMP cyclohydrolase [Oceanidesulfovibrio indonesiensis]TVM14591.1 IMP cyclohydrolase [Oceanidesulfovibrio indonesiensis]
MDRLVIKRAILSVTDKSGLADFARNLAGSGVELVSTGGTAKLLAGEGLDVTEVSQVTGFPEIMGGRVKTLHPAIHAGVLADKDNPEHMATLAELCIKPFDLVCVNLYNFAEAAKKELPLHEAVEQIDIGGPTLLRAAAKNFHSMLVVPGPDHYAAIVDEIQKDGAVSLTLRKKLAAETFAAVSAYDAMIASYLAEHEA